MSMDDSHPVEEQPQAGSVVEGTWAALPDTALPSETGCSETGVVLTLPVSVELFIIMGEAVDETSAPFMTCMPKIPPMTANARAIIAPQRRNDLIVGVLFGMPMVKSFLWFRCNLSGRCELYGHKLGEIFERS